MEEIIYAIVWVIAGVISFLITCVTFSKLRKDGYNDGYKDALQKKPNRYEK